jgi:hypothetical protein
MNMIDPKTFEEFIVHCSKDRFDLVVRLLLREVFHTDATNVDYTGDGGGDFVVIPKEGGPRAFVSGIRAVMNCC